MKDFLSIGNTPGDEPCAQLTSDCDKFETYRKDSRLECTALINMLRRLHGNEPGTARLSIKGCEHEFGTYYEVICRYDDQDEKAIEYAYKCEDLPENWDCVALTELKTGGYSFPKM